MNSFAHTSASNVSKAVRWLSRSWRHTMIIAVLAGFVISIWLGRELLLRGAASLWIISDRITHADAIVVLGGNYQLRPLVAADLYRRGFADKVLISQAPDGASLVKLGVPPNAVELFGTANTNTRDEAVALREWAKHNAASVFIIPSEIFNARRVRWIFDRVFSGSATTIEVPSFEEPRYYTRSEWWKTEYGVTAFKTGLQKYVYYRLKY